MKIQRLSWAGIQVEENGTCIAIDPLYNVNTSFFGDPREAFYPLDEYGAPDAILVTHLHTDHFDPKAIQTFYGSEIPVYVPRESLDQAKKSGLSNVSGMRAGESVQIGCLKVTSTYSVDGLGDPQTAWVIEGEQKIIHCGDTLWHGYWWKIREQFGEFAAAFLPANQAVIEDPDLTPSHEPICLSPEQAVSAAALLGCKLLIPIHFQAFHNPPLYQPTANIVERLTERSRVRGIHLRVMHPKEWLDLAEADIAASV